MSSVFDEVYVVVAVDVAGATVAAVAPVGDAGDLGGRVARILPRGKVGQGVGAYTCVLGVYGGASPDVGVTSEYCGDGWFGSASATSERPDSSSANWVGAGGASAGIGGIS